LIDDKRLLREERGGLHVLMSGGGAGVRAHRELLGPSTPHSSACQVAEAVGCRGAVARCVYTWLPPSLVGRVFVEAAVFHDDDEGVVGVGQRVDVGDRVTVDEEQVSQAPGSTTPSRPG
jgi:hypothetical protein